MSHRWNFYRAGGVEQVVLQTGADLANLEHLDRKLWVALACPVKGLELEPRTLELVDTDKDGRIRVPDVLAAVKWAGETFTNLDELFNGGDTVALAAIKDQAVARGARRILTNLGKGDATSVSLGDVADTAKIFADAQFNGDGVIPADAADDAAVKKILEDIITTHGSVVDRSGKPGVNQALVDTFFSEAAAYSEWQSKADGDRALLPLGEEGTAAAAAAVAAVKAKIDDYFTRCRLAAFDQRAEAALNWSEADYGALAPKDLSNTSKDVAQLPISTVAAGKALSLSEKVNPAWSAATVELTKAAVGPLLSFGKYSLTEDDWQVLQAKLAAYSAWSAGRPTTKVEPLGAARLKELSGGDFKLAITALIQKDQALEAESSQILLVEKLVRFQRDLVILVNNFVNFSAFYGCRGAIFQAGTLFLDGRGCDLSLRVEDAGKHAALGALAKCFLVYCDCTRDAAKMTIVSAITQGDSDNLMVGRNGVFYDRKGQDWDATITKIIESPISVRQAFWAPYKRFIRLVEENTAKRAAASETEANAKLTEAASKTATADKTKAEPKAAVESKKIDVGTVAALGVAVGGIGTFVGLLLGTLFGLGRWMPLGLLSILLAISGPSMLIAALKLRQRNLGPLLDANGWAINSLTRINIPLGGAMTSVAKLPPGAHRSLKDPFAEKSRPWGWYLFLLVLIGLGVAWGLGLCDAHLPQSLRRASVLGGTH